MGKHTRPNGPDLASELLDQAALLVMQASIDRTLQRLAFIQGQHPDAHDPEAPVPFALTDLGWGREAPRGGDQ